MRILVLPEDALALLAALREAFFVAEILTDPATQNDVGPQSGKTLMGIELSIETDRSELREFLALWRKLRSNSE